MSEIKYMQTEKGNYLMENKGYLFCKKSTFQETTYWVCVRSKNKGNCSKKIYLRNGLFHDTSGFHNHEPEKKKIVKTNFIKSIRDDLNSDPTTPMPLLYKKHLAIWAKDEEVASFLPSYDSIRTSLYNTRKKRPSISSVKNVGERKRNLLEEEIMKTRSDLLSLNGRRIVDINFFINGILELSDHGNHFCSFKNMMLISETRKGFQSGFEFRCGRCSLTKTIWTESNSIPINSAAVEGMAAIGRGFSSLERFSNALNIPCDISIYEYATDQTTVTQIVEAAEDKKQMEEAEQEKKRLKRSQDRKKRREEEAAERKKRLEEATEEEKRIIIAEEQKKKTALDKCYVYVDWTKISQGKDSQSSEASIKKQSEAVIGSEPDSVLGLEPKILSVAPAAELDSTMLITPDIDPPDLSAPGPSNRMEPDSSMSEKDVHLAMTCEVYPADAAPPTEFVTKVKEEPIDPDTYKQDILSATVVQELNSVTKDSSVTSSQVGSLFQPPVLIKEEPVSSEDEL